MGHNFIVGDEFRGCYIKNKLKFESMFLKISFSKVMPKSYDYFVMIR
jgi:hypothetical protein